MDNAKHYHALLGNYLTAKLNLTASHAHKEEAVKQLEDAEQAFEEARKAVMSDGELRRAFI